MRVNITQEERWPEYIVWEDDDGQYEIDYYLMYRYNRAVEEFDTVQEEIRQVCEEQN